MTRTVVSKDKLQWQEKHSQRQRLEEGDQVEDDGQITGQTG